jgi:ubiquinone/menaquinone biosynthesis C-methylase UbiE
MSMGYENIRIAGGDTAQPLAMAKRLAIIQRCLQPQERRFLDCGCGAGEYVLALFERCGLDAQGIEFDEAKVRQAHQKPALRERVFQGDLQALPFAANTWDAAMVNEVLEHVPDERRALTEIARVLKSNGKLIVFSPNRWFPFETHGVRLRRNNRAVPPYVPLIPYLPLPVGKQFFHYWARNYWQSELAEMMTGQGFEILERTFVWQTFEGISGRQPRVIAALKPFLRSLSNTLERLPGARRFGVSQVLICRKP